MLIEGLGPTTSLPGITQFRSPSSNLSSLSYSYVLNVYVLIQPRFDARSIALRQSSTLKSNLTGVAPESVNGINFKATFLNFPQAYSQVQPSSKIK